MEEKNMREWVSLFKSDGETNVMGFCRKHDLDYQRFRYHLKRSLLLGPGSGGFAGIVIQNKAITAFGGKGPRQADIVARLLTGGQVRLEVEGSFTATFLRELAGC